MASRREQKEQIRADREAAALAAQARAKRKRQWLLLGGAGGLGLIVALVLILASQSGTDDTERVEPGLLAGVPQQGIALGRDKAPVTLVEFADPQCPFCAEFSDRIFPRIVDEFVAAGELRMELRLLSFLGPDSVEATLVAAGAAEQDRIWPFMESFFANQGTENSGYVDEDFLREVGDGIEGLDIDAAIDAAEGDAATELLSEADSLAAEFDIASTPTLLIGPTGGKLEQLEFGALEFAEFERAISQELRDARG